MKNLLLYFILTFSLPSLAVTKATFFGLQTMIQVTPKDSYGNTDLDSVNIYRAMNVPVENSFLGPGKKIVTADKILNFICAIRSGNYECSIIIQRSNATEMDPINKKLKYHVTGALADELRAKFILDHDTYKFISTDTLLKIESSPGHFTLSFAGDGAHL